jgi:hypothetical protein
MMEPPRLRSIPDAKSLHHARTAEVKGRNPRGLLPGGHLPELQHHLDTYSIDGPDGLVFVNEHVSRGIAETSIRQFAGLVSLAHRRDPDRWMRIALGYQRPALT